MKDFLKIGLIQPVINPEIDWNHDQDFVNSEKAKGKSTPYRLNIHPIFAERVWQEIQEGLRLFLRNDNRPDMILIPELHLPVARVEALKRITKRYGVIIIAGVDFQRNHRDLQKIRNRGVLIFPHEFGEDGVSKRVTALHFGKTYFTYMEKSMFKNIDGISCSEEQEQNMYLFKTKLFGNFGIMICSDIFDLERMMLYQTRIHHLLIISLNKDLNTYLAMAESLTRLLYCNVVICNTGHFGESLAFSPYTDVNERILYKYYGQRSFNVHQVALPVNSLAFAQAFDFSNDKKGIKFKASPPGYFEKFSVNNI